MRSTYSLLLSALLVSMPASARAQSFRPDDPIRIDPDTLPAPKPKRIRINDYYDFVENTFLPRGEKQGRRAVNINTLGEVPDSSWYTNRIGIGAMPPDALVRGPDSGGGPARGEWTIVAGKSQGISPGFRIRDARRDEYFLKFDPASNPEMATAAEVISTKLFHALGYNVPENYLVELDPAKLRIHPEASIDNELGEKVPLTRERIDKLLAGVARRPDGTIRAVASRRLAGEPIGPFKFYGTRGDDANDVFPHEHRRELRGYYVFSSWLNHDDSRSVNTLDVYVREGGGGYVKHYLLDFGSTLGSGSVSAQKRRAGNEYLWEAKPALASIATLGLRLRPWVRIEYPDIPSVGRFEAKSFRPERWKPEYPNAAFRHMDLQDAFWAARQVMKLSDEDVRAVVKTGRLSDRRAEAYLAETLIARRDKIGNHWLRQVSSLDDFRVEGGALLFDDLLVTFGFEPRMREHHVTFTALDNRTGARSALGRGDAVREPRVALPPAVVAAADGALAVVTLSAGANGVEVFLRKSAGALEVVGVERR